MGFYRVEADELREYIVWVAHYTGWGYRELMEMPVLTLVDWFESVSEFHNERLSEQQSLMSGGNSQKRFGQGFM